MNGYIASTPSITTGGGGGGGGGGASIVLPPSPSDFKALPGDGQIFLQWKNSAVTDFVRVVIIRKIGEAPASRNDGEKIYEGTMEEYTDTNLNNDTVYYYAIYSFNREMYYSGLVILRSQPQIGMNIRQTEEKEESKKTEEKTPVAEETKESEGSNLKPPTIVFSKRLYFGITDENTGVLQMLLSQDPALYPEGLITGYFGSLTKAAIQKFQCKYNIVCSGNEATTGYGRPGPLTRAKLNELIEAGFYNEIILKKPEFFFRPLFAGIVNDDVKRLQELLSKEASIYPEGFMTGYFGPFTKSAVQKFQCKYNIVCEGDENTTGYGRVGPRTRAKLNKIQYGQR